MAPGDADPLRGTARAEMRLGRWDERVGAPTAGRTARSPVRLDAAFRRSLSLTCAATPRRARYRPLLALAPANLRGSSSRHDASRRGRPCGRTGRARRRGKARRARPRSWRSSRTTRISSGSSTRESATCSAGCRRRPSTATEAPGQSPRRRRALRGDAAEARAYAARSANAFEAQPRSALPMIAQPHALTRPGARVSGRKDEAIREGQRGVALDSRSKDAIHRHLHSSTSSRRSTCSSANRTRRSTSSSAFENPLLRLAGWLKIDPNFDPLRKNPRFQKLVAGGK